MPTLGTGSVNIVGLKEFRSALKSFDSAWGSELTKTNKSVVEKLVPLAQGAAGGYGRMTAAAARSFRATATQQSGKIAFGGNPAYALAAVMGAKRHTGWYAQRGHNASSTPQFPEWVGNSWDVGGSGGPRGINDAIRAERDAIPQWYYDALIALAERAFPD